MLKQQHRGFDARKMLGLMTAIILVACMAGCSGASGSGGQGSAGAATPDGGAVKGGANQQPVTLTLWNRWPELKESFTETASEFHNKYPNITVNIVDVSTQQFKGQMQTAIAGNQLPDMFPNGDYGAFPQLVSMNLLRPLDELFTPDLKKRYDQGVWTEGTSMMSGHIYSYPLYTPRRPGIVMYYNPKVLQQYGLSEKDVPKTWDELVAVSQKIKQASHDQVYGLVVGFKSPFVATPVTSQMATAISPEVAPSNQFNYKTGKYELNSPGIVETIQFFKKLFDQKIMHPNSLLSDAPQASSLFASGKAAFLINGVWQVSTFESTQKFTDFDVAPLPTKDGKAPYRDYNGTLPATLYVNKNTEHPEEVQEFLSFMTDSFYPKLIQKGIEYPPIPDVSQKYKAANNPQFDNAEQLQNQMFVLVPQPFSRNPVAIDVQTELNGKLPKIALSDVVVGYLAGQIKDLQENLDTLTGQYNKAFADTVAKVNSSGKKISPDDYAFANWAPFQPYGPDQYAALKK